MSNQLKMAKRTAIDLLVEQGWSQRKISRELGIDRETVARYLRLEISKPAISTAGNSAALEPEIPSEKEEDSAPIETMKSTVGRKSSCAPWAKFIEEKAALGLSAQRIFQDLKCEADFLGSYESVKRFVSKLGRTLPLPFRRMESGPGEEAQVDFGQGGWTLGPNRKRRYRPHLFRLVLSCSRKGYTEVVRRQSTEDFIRCLENAFWRLGGVTKTVVIDNLKAAVIKSDWYDPTINPKFEAFARHYGFVVLPARPRMARHKGKVEAGVKYAQENAVKGKEFRSLEEQNAYLSEWEKNVADQRIHGTTQMQVRQAFESIERSALLPLPGERFPL